MTKTSLGLLTLLGVGSVALSCSGGDGGSGSGLLGWPGTGAGGWATTGTGGWMVMTGSGGIVSAGPDAGAAAATTGAVAGTVTLVGGGRAAGATVTLGSSKTTTSADGSFSFSSLVPVDRAVVTITSKGYVPTSRPVRVRAGATSRVDAALGLQGPVQQIDASLGGTAASGTASVVLPAAGLVDASGNPYVGKAGVQVTPFDPTTTDGQSAFPGEFRGISDTGQEIPIMSYGYMDVTVTDSQGNVLQLAPGKTADIAIPIPASLAATAPATMPTWYFDPSDGQWHQVGVGVKSGNVYKHTIPHFSIWNTDVGYDRSYVKGRVIGCDGKPLKGATVAIRGVTPRNCWTSGERSTDDNGLFPANDDPYGFRYAGVPVDANGTASIVAMKDGASSTSLVFSTPASEQVINLGDFCVCATSVCGAKDAGVLDAPRKDAALPDGPGKDTALRDGPGKDVAPGTDAIPGSGNYNFVISGLAGSCDTETDISGTGNVVVTGSQLTITLYGPEGDPLTLTGTMTGASWSTTTSSQYTWNDDLCTETDLITTAGTATGTTFTGTLQFTESYSGQCPSMTNCQSSGKLQLTKM